MIDILLSTLYLGVTVGTIYYVLSVLNNKFIDSKRKDGR